MLHPLYFLVGCLGSRALLAYLAGVASAPWLMAMAMGLLAVAVGFAVIYVAGLRKTGLETGGAPIWWDSLRPVHSLLYFLAAWRAWVGDNRGARLVLGVDVLLGLGSFAWHRGLRGLRDE